MLTVSGRLHQDREAKCSVKLVMIGDLASGKTDMAVTYIQVSCQDHIPSLWATRRPRESAIASAFSSTVVPRGRMHAPVTVSVQAKRNSKTSG